MVFNFNNYLNNHSWQIEPTGLYEPIGYTLESGGKRLRPMLVIMGCELFGGKAEQAFDAAMSIEVFHNFTLLHDDLMDKADVRRNRATVHKKWDANTAILSGDAMLIKAYEFMQRIPANKWEKVFPLFTQTALEVCEGQQYDMLFESRIDVSVADYFKMIRLKTAVLIAASLKVGAILSNAPEKEADLLYNFGIAIGIAFQLRDDYLDVYGTPEVLGKAIGGDILCQKKTFLMTSALATSDTSLRESLIEVMQSENISDEEKIDRVTQIFNSANIPHLCEQAMEDYYHQAIACLDKIEVEELQKAPLYELAKKLMGRTS